MQKNIKRFTGLTVVTVLASSGLAQVALADDAQNTPTTHKTTVSGQSASIGGNKWYSGKLAIQFKLADDEGIQSLSAVVNGETKDIPLTKLDEINFEGTLDIENLPVGATTITLTAVDRNGNPSSWEETILYDASAPVVEASIISPHSITGETLFASNLAINFNIIDGGAGVKSAIMKIGDETFDITQGTINLTKGGTPVVTVEDFLGNQAVYAFEDLIPGAKTISLGSQKPTTSLEILGTKQPSGWWVGNETLKVKVVSGLEAGGSGDALLRDVQVSVNGVVVAQEEVLAPTSELLIPVENSQNAIKGRYDIVVTATSVFGDQAVATDYLYADFDAPILDSGSVDGSPVNTHEEKTFANGPIKILFNATDSASGVWKTELLHNGTVLESKLGPGWQSFTLPESGVYKIRVSDHLGQSREYDLNELFGLGEAIVLDNTLPTIKAELLGDRVAEPNGQIWFNQMPQISYEVEDENFRRMFVTNETSDGERLKVADLPDISGTVDLSKVIPEQDGSVRIIMKASDWAQNARTKTFAFKLDTQAPEITKYSHTGTIKTFGANGYINEPIVVNFGAGDALSGVKQIQVLQDSVLIKTIPLDDLENLSFTINQSGVYSLNLIDIAGNERLVQPTEIGLPQTIVFDANAPSINASFEGESKEVDGVPWHTAIPKLNLNVSDENLETVKVGYVLDGEQHFLALDQSSGSIELEDVPAVNGLRTIFIEATDKAGNTSQWTKEFRVDNLPPELANGELDETGNYQNGKTFFNQSLKASIEINDLGAGVESLKLIKNGEAQNIEITENKATFTLEQSGVYALQATDRVGNQTEVSFEDAFGVSGEIVIDEDKPLIDTVFSDPETVLNNYPWWGKTPALSIAVSDENLSGVVVKVDGEVVSTEDQTVLNLADFWVGEEAGVKIEVEATDFAGNKTYWSKTIFVDETPPEILSPSYTPSFKVFGDTAYTQGEIEFSFVPQDTGAGLKTVYLVNKTDGSLVGLQALNGVPTSAVINRSGEYAIRVTDKLDNFVELSMSDVFGDDFPNKIVLDTDAPTQSVSLDGVSTDVDGATWFVSPPVLKATISDTNLAVTEVYVNDTQVALGVDEVVYDLAQVASEGTFAVRVVSTDKAGNQSVWEETVFVDQTPPQIERFEFNAPGFKEGDVIGGNDNYGFFFQNTTNVNIIVKDEGVSAGLQKIDYELINHINGKVTSGSTQIVGGVATVQIPNNFKGTIKAKPFDRAGNVGGTGQPSAVVVEDANWHVNTAEIGLSLPPTDKRDALGLPLFNSFFNAGLTLKEPISGFRSAKWGVGDAVLGNVEISKDGAVSGSGFNVNGRDKNLVVDLSSQLPVSLNSNNVLLWVETIDRAGHTSKTQQSFSIDTDAPVVNVRYDRTTPTNYYSTTRTAVITVNERNFDPNKVEITGKPGLLGTWSLNSDGLWQATMSFVAESDYEWSLRVIDRAGNVSNTVSSERFTVDTTIPSISLAFDNNSSVNGKYFATGRTATITVVDRNFDPGATAFTGTGSLSPWIQSGDTWTSRVSFTADGDYGFSVQAFDRAGNASLKIDSGAFTIDQTTPALTVSGVENGVTYRKDVALEVSVEDALLDVARTQVILDGRSRGRIELVGGLEGGRGVWRAPDFEMDKSFDDAYTLTVITTDLAGNVVEDRREFIVNRFGSEFTFLQSAYLGKYVQAVSEDVSLSELSVEKLDQEKTRLVVLRDGVEVPLKAGDVSITEKGGSLTPWEYQYVLRKDLFADDGEYQVQAFTASVSGVEQSTLSQELVFAVDSVAPEIVVSGVVDGGIYQTDTRLVTVDVRDAGQVSDVVVRVDGEVVEPEKTGDVLTLNLKENSKGYNISVTALDYAGNKAEKTISDVIVTNSWWTALWAQNPFRTAVIGAGALILALGALLTRRGIKARKQEKQRIAYAEEAVNNSRSSGASTEG